MLKTPPLKAVDLVAVDPEPFKWRMGVRPLNLDQWLLVDEDRVADLNEIGALIDNCRDEIIYCEPSAVAACQELAAEVVEHLRRVSGLSSMNWTNNQASL